MGSNPDQNPDLAFDFVIIGSGFGGSVSAMRLAQKGYSVAILETGKRLQANDFPKTNWRAWKYFWAPIIKFFGPQRISFLKGVMILHGVGVGGGSLVYANTLMKPKTEVFQDSAWPKGNDWEKELEPHFETARMMLGVAENPYHFEGEDALRKLAKRMGVEDTYHPTEVGVFFGEPGETVPDPYFSGAGPERTGCISCGGCMVGCRHNAKNTLDKNYLYFAEKWGTKIFPETKADKITPTQDGYTIDTVHSTSWFKKKGKRFFGKKIILSAGVLGSVGLLMKNRDVHKTLPHLSAYLGKSVRTNGESLIGATSFDAHRDLSRGIAIGAAIHPDSKTKIEMVRYPEGSGAMRTLGTLLTPDGTHLTRPLKAIWQLIRRFPRYVRLWTVKDWAKSSVILLVMQYLDQQIELNLGRSIFSGFRKKLQGAPTGHPLPSYFQIAQDAGKIIAEEINGEPQNVITEAFLKVPATAHILGGCRMGDTPEKGAINKEHEVFGYSGLYVCDGSVVPCNLAVNPSFTITALAERFASYFPPHPNLDKKTLESRQIHFGSKK